MTTQFHTLPLTALDPEQLSWKEWLDFGVKKIGAQMGSLFNVLLVLQERSRQRHILNGLSDSMLKDIGLTRLDVYRECRKAPWMP